MAYIQIEVIIALTLSGFEISLFCLFTGAVSTHYNNFEFYSGIDFKITQLCPTNGSMESVCPWELRTDLETRRASDYLRKLADLLIIISGI